MIHGAQAISYSPSADPSIAEVYRIQSGMITVTATTPADYDTLITIPTLTNGVKWKLYSVDYSSATTLATHATAILTFTIINKGNSDAQMLSTGLANTTTTTTGSGVTAYTKRALVLSSTPANLVATSGNVLIVRLTSGGAGVATHNLGNMHLTFIRNAMN